MTVAQKNKITETQYGKENHNKRHTFHEINVNTCKQLVLNYFCTWLKTLHDTEPNS